MKTLRTPSVLAFVTLAASLTVPTGAFAQRATARATATASSAPSNANRDPATLHQDAPLATTNVGSGTAPTAGNGPIGELRGNTAPAPDAAITGPIGPSDVARIMQAQMPRLRPCYETARATHPQLAGRLDVRFTLGRDGHVTQAAAYGMADAPEVATCVADTLRQTTFPQPQGGSLQFIYPIMFQPPAPVRARGRGARPTTPAHPAARH